MFLLPKQSVLVPSVPEEVDAAFKKLRGYVYVLVKADQPIKLLI
jgi:hypothetical protein